MLFRSARFAFTMVSRLVVVIMFAILASAKAFLISQRRVVRQISSMSANKRHNSATGVLYEASRRDSPTIRLFTKEGCTLCDKVKDVRI